MRQIGDTPGTGLVAFLLTDVEGSVRRWETYPDLMGQALARHESLLRAEIMRCGGVVFKGTGDGLYAAFQRPSSAIEAAVAAQRALARSDFSEVGGLPIRMAIYAGYVEAEGGDYYGLGINRAARLLALAHGEQIIVGAAAADLSHSLLPAEIGLRPLGPHRLKDVPDEESVYQVESPELRATFPPLSSGRATINNLPGQLGRYIERPALFSAVNERLRQHRIVTLIGPGGVGKTRLAVEIGFDQLDKGFDEVWSVELAALTDPLLVAEMLCCTVGVEIPHGHSGAQAAISYFKNRSAFLILDNCEHLVEACSALVERLVRSCPRVTVLATSRESLAIDGECTVRVSGLALPAQGRGAAEMGGAAWALGFEAVRLFADRAAAVDETFTVTDENAEAVCSICRQLDGIPIAIEVVVPQLRVMPIESLVRSLPDRLLRLPGRRTGVARHQSLEALFDWSYNLLRPGERSLFRRLSVFADSWTLEAAEDVAGASGETGGPGRGQILDRLTPLIEKSLAVVSTKGTQTRYGYLQPVRRYASQRLRSVEAHRFRQRLARYVHGRFEAAAREWPTTATEAWLGAYEPELENLRVSLDWAFSADGDIGLALELTGQAARMWDELSLFAERRRYVALAVERAPADMAPVARARLALASLSNSAHGDRSNQEPALRAAELFRQAGDRLGEGEALAKAGAAVLTPDSIGEAAPLLQQALDILAPLGLTKPGAACLRSLSVSRYFAADFEEASAFLRRSEAMALSLGDEQGIAAAQIAGAELAFASRRPEEAVAITEDMLAKGRCNRRQRVLGLSNLAAYRLDLDRTVGAADAALKALEEARALDWPAAITRAVEHLALVLALRGHAELAAKLLGFGDHFYADKTASREYTETATADRLRRLLEASCDPLLREQALATGATWDVQRAAVEVVRGVNTG